MNGRHLVLRPSNVVLASVALAACHGPAPLGTIDAACALDAGTAPLACDRPTPIDPAAVVDLASFRVIASAAVCDWSLRCEWLLGPESFCHPSFAAREARLAGATPPFDLGLARTCVAQLAATSACNDAFAVALDCLAINDGSRTNLQASGDACSNTCGGLSPFCACSFGLMCVAGHCAPLQPRGAPCSDASPCQPSLACSDGTCDFPHACSNVACGPVLECHGDPAACVAPECGSDTPFTHHVGCACASDFDCPADVAACVLGACTLRPFVGDACTLDGARCFGSACADGRCVPLRAGEGFCGADLDCASGLLCGDSFVSGSGICGPPLALGAMCGWGLPGRCSDGLVCNGTVTCCPLSSRGTCVAR